MQVAPTLYCKRYHVRMERATLCNVAPCAWVSGARRFRCLLAQAVLLGCGSTTVRRNVGTTHPGDMNPQNSERRKYKRNGK